MKAFIFSLIFFCACAGTSYQVPEQDPVDAGQEACSVTYQTEAGNPCDGPNPCWQWQTTSGQWIPKGNSCPFNCICGTPNSYLNRPIACGCGGYCRFGGCLSPK